jgi:hypothetical protein
MLYCSTIEASSGTAAHINEAVIIPWKALMSIHFDLLFILQNWEGVQV